MKKSPPTAVPRSRAAPEPPHRETKSANGPRPSLPTPPSRGASNAISRNKSEAALRSNGLADGYPDPEQVLAGLIALKKGDFKMRLPLGWTGIGGKVADTFNEVAEMM